MKKVKASTLVLDYTLYPRNDLDTYNVTSMVNALNAGHELPPIIVDKKTRKVVDGFHRREAHLKFYGEDAEIDVIEKSFESDADLFLEAMRLNASHGIRLDSHDRTHCLLIAERLSIPLESIAGALRMPTDKLGALRVDRTAVGSSGLTVPLKRTVSRQFSGQTLTPRQEEANQKLGGMSQLFYVNQLIELCESDMIDVGDSVLMRNVRKLVGLLGAAIESAPAPAAPGEPPSEGSVADLCVKFMQEHDGKASVAELSRHLKRPYGAVSESLQAHPDIFEKVKSGHYTLAESMAAV